MPSFARLNMNTKRWLFLLKFHFNFRNRRTVSIYTNVGHVCISWLDFNGNLNNNKPLIFVTSRWELNGTQITQVTLLGTGSWYKSILVHLPKRKWISPGNAIITDPRPIHGTVRKRHRAQTVTMQLNPYKPSVLFVAHRQIVQNQTRRRKTRRLIRFLTVCLHKFILKCE